MGRSRMVWVPAVVIQEVESLRQEKKCRNRSSAFEELANYAKVGRELERIMNIRIWPLSGGKR